MVYDPGAYTELTPFTAPNTPIVPPMPDAGQPAAMVGPQLPQPIRTPVRPKAETARKWPELLARLLLLVGMAGGGKPKPLHALAAAYVGGLNKKRQGEQTRLDAEAERTRQEGETQRLLQLQNVMGIAKGAREHGYAMTEAGVKPASEMMTPPAWMLPAGEEPSPIPINAMPGLAAGAWRGENIAVKEGQPSTGAQTDYTRARTVTEGERPGLVRSQTAYTDARTGLTQAQTAYWKKVPAWREAELAIRQDDADTRRIAARLRGKTAGGKGKMAYAVGQYLDDRANIDSKITALDAKRTAIETAYNSDPMAQAMGPPPDLTWIEDEQNRLETFGSALDTFYQQGSVAAGQPPFVINIGTGGGGGGGPEALTPQSKAGKPGEYNWSTAAGKRAALAGLGPMAFVREGRSHGFDDPQLAAMMAAATPKPVSAGKIGAALAQARKAARPTAAVGRRPLAPKGYQSNLPGGAYVSGIGRVRTEQH